MTDSTMDKMLMRQLFAVKLLGIMAMSQKANGCVLPELIARAESAALAVLSDLEHEYADRCIGQMKAERS